MNVIRPGDTKVGNKWHGTCPHCSCMIECNDKDLVQTESVYPYAFCPDCDNYIKVEEKDTQEAAKVKQLLREFVNCEGRFSQDNVGA